MKMKNLYVAENCILVLPEEAPDKSKGGILIPDSAKDAEQRRQGQRGTVVAVGVRRIDATGQRFDSQFSPGHLVAYSRYAGTALILDDKEHVVLREDDILLVLPAPA